MYISKGSVYLLKGAQYLRALTGYNAFCNGGLAINLVVRGDDGKSGP